jgi:hypothetical protein
MGEQKAKGGEEEADTTAILNLEYGQDRGVRI